MTGADSCAACRGLLPQYAAGSATSDERYAVERHAAGCAACAQELTAWNMVAAVSRASAAAAHPVLPLETSWDALAARLPPHQVPQVERMERIAMPAEARGVVPALSHVAQVAFRQARVLRTAIWIASALGIALAVLYALTLPRVVGEQDVLAFALPLIAATGVAFLYGPEVDVGLELALAAPTSPRLVLLSRFALLFGYDATLALGGTLALAWLRHDTFATLVAVWLGPMALVATLSLALSLLLGPAVAVAGAASLWLSQALRVGDGVSLHITAGPFWPTTPWTLVGSLALLAAALFVVPFQERLRPDFDPQQ